MNSAERLLRLFDYDVWANRKILNALEEHPTFDKRGKSLDLFYHVIGTQHHWYHRATGAELPNTEIWPEFLLADCKTLIQSNHQRWTELIEHEADNLDQTISYQNSKGVRHESLLSDVMHHIIIHGQHHRSQIAMLLRMSDVAPPGTDFIFYTRE